ncbi:uncharacterized protein LOC108916277 [Anoplophora glabripennis]|uniref:uncharacterized protein LOC108916277 n=1 Tax=Anoplophora glabripennis TaxID=217634 RepID=UPI000873A6CC|nr:uncharacterized protein LOC108916277 [Anoplophora glabripennis]
MAPKIDWSREATKWLIELYESHPYLYKTTHADYKNTTKRVAAIKLIKNALEESKLIENVTEEEVNRNIHGLRSQYFMELAKLKASYTSGSGTDDIYLPKLWSYQLLSFLKDSAPVRESISNLDENTEITEDGPQKDQENSDIVFDGFVEDLDNFQYETDSSATPSTSRPSTAVRRKRRCTLQTKAMSVIEHASEVLASTVKKSNDICAFGYTIATELGEIKNPHILRETKRHIFNLVIDAQDNDSN